MTALPSSPDAALADVAIIGGGFSGTLLAIQMMRAAGAIPCRIVLLERRERVGPGLAYATTFIDHLLNVPAARMSAFPDAPADFLDWLHRTVGPVDGRAFVPRRLYGQYLADTLATVRAAHPAAELVQCRADVVGCDFDLKGSAWVVRVRDGDDIPTRRVVLAVGNARPANPLNDPVAMRAARFVPDPWNADALAACAGREPLLLLGSGLTALDVVLMLRSLGQTGPVFALSRRGLTPHAHHASRSAPPDLRLPERLAVQLATAEVNADGVRCAGSRLSLSALLRELRRIARECRDWRILVDQLRPLTNPLWRRLDASQRRSFLRHARSYWDVHRHRAAPVIAAQVAALRRSGGLVILSGRIGTVRADADGLVAEIRPRGGGAATGLRVARVINCTGPDPNPARSADPLLLGLLRDGHARADALGLGLVTTPSGAMVAADGTVSDSLFALGAMRRPLDWESTAVPELRVQAAALARALMAAPETAIRTA
ncbi:MAG: FAD/NAD(P)-binding protein [Planctomycetia bacterium]|nr:MAG: FAD/NAD(P)-binding protein [Planctomycetia bacterium]